MPSGPPSPSLSSSSLVEDGVEQAAAEADGGATTAVDVDSEVKDIASPSHAKVVDHCQSCIDELSFSPSADNLIEQQSAGSNTNNANNNTNNNSAGNDDLQTELPPLPPRGVLPPRRRSSRSPAGPGWSPPT